MKYIGILLALVLLATEAYTGFYVVDQSQYALVFGFGQVQAVVTEPGLYMKWPMPIQREMLLDSRIQTTSKDAFNFSTIVNNFKFHKGIVFLEFILC